MKTWNITTPLTDSITILPTAGDTVYISGIIYTARDTAHKRLIEIMNQKKTLPFELKGQVIFFVGPTPPPPGYEIGSAGPTTSGRMDIFSPKLLDGGLKAMIGKGPRSMQVVESIVKNNALYLIAVGGIGALISKSIKKSTVIAFPELGTEAVRELEVDKLPTIVGIDVKGNDLYKRGPESYLSKIIK
ncbi:MAG: Fe-S-containing hydro-lyase [Caldisericia bacterium]|nr:Fe-S-containing hydro-lyase [Caldisericia bacterium]